MECNSRRVTTRVSSVTYLVSVRITVPRSGTNKMKIELEDLCWQGWTPDMNKGTTIKVSYVRNSVQEVKG